MLKSIKKIWNTYFLTFILKLLFWVLNGEVIFVHWKALCLACLQNSTQPKRIIKRLPTMIQGMGGMIPHPCKPMKPYHKHMELGWFES